MRFVKGLGIGVAVALVVDIVAAVVAFLAGVHINIPFLFEGGQVAGESAPSLSASVDPLGIAVLGLLGGAIALLVPHRATASPAA